MGDIPNQDGRTAAICPDGDQLNILNRAQVAAPSNHVFRAGHFQDTAAHLRITVPDRFDDRLDRQPIGGQRVRIYLDLILFDEPADRGHFCHSRHTFQLVAQVPVLKAAELSQIVRPGLVHQRVLIDPPDSRGIRSQRRCDAGRKLPGEFLEIFQHATPRPIQVCPVFEDHVHVRDPIFRDPPHSFNFRPGEQGRDEWIGDLVFNQRGAAPLPFGVDDHLDIGQVRNRIQRNLQ